MKYAPGCFGSALNFDATSQECKTCQSLSQCATKAAETSAFLKKELGVASLPTERKKSGRAKKTDKTSAVDTTDGTSEAMVSTEMAVSSGLSKKSADIVQKVLKDGIVLADWLQEKKNPFGHRSSPFLRIACEMLIDGGFTRKDLRAKYMSTLNWSDGTANSHVSMICAAFPALGAVKEVNGTFVVIGDNDGN